MRVLHVCHQYHPAVGGAERYITELSVELARRKHQVDVFTSRSTDYMTWANSLPSPATVDGVDIYRFASLPRRRHTWHALDFGLQGYARSRKALFEPFVLYGNGPISPTLAAALLRRVQDYDLVHIASLHYAHAWTAFKVAKLRSVPIALTPFVHIDQPETFDIGYMRRMLRDSDVVFAVTGAERDMLLAQGLAERVAVTGGGLHLEDFPSIDRRRARARFDLADETFVVLFLGRKTAYKGLDTCVEAIDILRRRHPDAALLAVGPETEYSQKLWAHHKSNGALVVRGSVSDQDRLAALAACDALALPSAGESFGIVFLEAWAYGKPVIGANIAAVASLIDDGEDGFLVDTRDPGQLAARLALLASQPEVARRLGDAGRRKLHARYTWRRIGDIVEGAYARVRRRHQALTGAPSCA